MAFLKNSQSSIKKSLEYSKDQKLNHILQNVVNDVKGYADRLLSQISELSDIGRSLSGIYDLNTLLEVIVDRARGFTHAEAGILYLKENSALHYRVFQNDSKGIRLGGTTGKSIPFEPVEMNPSNISAFVVLEGQSVNIPDIYESDLFDFSSSKKLDLKTNYRTQSLLVVPMRNHEDEVIGVLRLMNALDPQTRKVIPFSPECENLTESLVSQAAMAIGNVKLIADMENLFEAFVQVMATAIDEKSPITGGHIRRVSDLTIVMAETVHKMDCGRFKDIFFDAGQMHELRIASWMHDIGKVTTPVEIMEKAKKLQTLFDRIQLIDLRMKYILERVRNNALQQKYELLQKGASARKIEDIEEKTRKINERVKEIRQFLKKCNEPYDSLGDREIERLKGIAQMTYIDDEGNRHPFLTADELENLSIRTGSITEAEREIMKDHAYITLKMLEQIPFTRQLKNIPKIAASHHEFINGRGYPLGLKGEEIPLAARLMAVTDIAEALTAHDRPYKKALPLDEVYKILRSMVQKGQLDHDLVELFIKENVYDIYKRKYEATSTPTREFSPSKNHIHKPRKLPCKIIGVQLETAP